MITCKAITVIFPYIIARCVMQNTSLYTMLLRKIVQGRFSDIGRQCKVKCIIDAPD
jgi:hypothetical protein